MHVILMRLTLFIFCFKIPSQGPLLSINDLNFPIIFETSEIHLNSERKRSFLDLLSVESRTAIKRLIKKTTTKKH